MASANKTKYLHLPQWEGNEHMKRVDWNAAYASIEEAVADVDYISNIRGAETVETKQTVGKYDTWTSVVTIEGQEVARVVEQESDNAGKAKWTTTITVENKAPFSFTEIETETGWKRSVDK